MGIKSKRVAFIFDETNYRRIEDMSPLERWCLENGIVVVHSALRGGWYQCARCGGKVEPFKKCGCRF